MGVFIIKRKNFDATSATDTATNAAKSGGGAKGFIKSMATPGAIANSVASSAVDELKNNLVNRPLTAMAEEASTYTPKVQNAYLQKSYGVVQAIKEIGTGVGKGLFDYAKQNKKTIGSMAKFGAGAAGLGYGTSRFMRRKAEEDAGITNTNGLTTGEKVATGVGTVGLGYLGYKSGVNSFNKNVANATKNADKYSKYVSRLEALGVTGEGNRARDKALNKARSLVESNTKDLNKLKDGKKILGMSRSTFKGVKRGAIGAGLALGAGLVTNKLLKKKKTPEEQKSYSFLSSIGKYAKNGFNAMLKSGKAGKDSAKLFKDQNRNIARGVENFFMFGNNGVRSMNNALMKNLRAQGKYGEKAANFINRHRTLTGAAGAAAVGGVGYTAASKIGEKPVELASKLDKRTSKFIKQGNLGGISHDKI